MNNEVKNILFPILLIMFSASCIQASEKRIAPRKKDYEEAKRLIDTLDVSEPQIGAQEGSPEWIRQQKGRKLAPDESFLMQQFLHTPILQKKAGHNKNSPA